MRRCSLLLVPLLGLFFSFALRVAARPKLHTGTYTGGAHLRPGVGGRGSPGVGGRGRGGVGGSSGSSSGGGGVQARMRAKRQSQREREKAKRASDTALMLVMPPATTTITLTTALTTPPAGSSSSSVAVAPKPIVLATVDCFTPSSVLVRNLLFSIARFTVKEHPVRFYVMHSFDRELLPLPESIICKNPHRCHSLLRYLREEKYIDVRFAPVINNSYVGAFRPCASSHLWFAKSLPHEPYVIYLNRDMIVKQDLQPLWSMFSWFPPEVVVATSLELNENFRARVGHVSPYRSGIRDRRGPYWLPPYGANAGMVLYDLTRMRDKGVVEDFEFIVALNMTLPLGDQDVLNYYLTQQPFRFRAVDCKWNFRADPKRDQDHCLTGGLSEGILHGSRKLYLEAAARSVYYGTDHPMARYYDAYVNSTRGLIIEFLENNVLLNRDEHWAV